MAKETTKSPSQLIDGRIKELGDWRGKMLAKVRGLIKQAAPKVVEEWKWRGVPVWYQDGIICTGETYKAIVKMTFANGAELADPTKLFNSSLDGNTAGPSTSTRPTSSTRMRSRRSSEQRSRSISPSPRRSASRATRRRAA